MYSFHLVVFLFFNYDPKLWTRNRSPDTCLTYDSNCPFGPLGTARDSPKDRKRNDHYPFIVIIFLKFALLLEGS